MGEKEFIIYLKEWFSGYRNAEVLSIGQRDI